MDLRQKGLSGSTLKWIAIITMFIDHAAIVLIYGWAKARHGWGAGIESLNFYYTLRTVGRLAFPLFCFLLSEGFRHTRSRGKYLLRLGLFALLSELPYDLALNDTWKVVGKAGVPLWKRIGLELGSQNVFFTLFLGLLAIWLWDSMTGGREGDCPPERGLIALSGVVALACAAHYAETDYGAMGVALILVMWLLRDRPWTRDLAAGGVLAAMIPFGSHWIELFGILSFPLMHLYNGQRGKQNKYFFYLFYPLHLLLLTCVGWLLFR